MPATSWWMTRRSAEAGAGGSRDGGGFLFGGGRPSASPRNRPQNRTGACRPEAQAHPTDPQHRPRGPKDPAAATFRAWARQRSPEPRPPLPWGPHPAALTRVPPSPTNSVGEGVHFRVSLRLNKPGARAGAPHPQPFPRKLRGGREPARCARLADTRFRSPPLRSTAKRGTGAGGGGSQGMHRQPGVTDRSAPLSRAVCGGEAGTGGFRGMHRQPIASRSKFSPLRTQFVRGGAGGGATPRHAPGPVVLPYSSTFRHS